MVRYILLFCLLLSQCLYGQIDSVAIQNQILDSLFIEEVEGDKTPVKILHAEPLYIDLIRDLGARKGEREWNLGFGLTDNLSYDTYQTLIEYEFAPVDRLGFEVEIPVTVIAAQRNSDPVPLPSSRVESIKLATQWSFLVADAAKISLALGYIQEFEFADLDNFRSPFFLGNVYNPFFVSAKRWGNHWHTLVYQGPRLHQLKGEDLSLDYQVNSNLHYMIPGTRNFVGIEANKSFKKNDFDMVLRPQMRVGIADNFLVGIVTGIPVDRENQRFSMFLRLIWEPRHQH